MVLVYILLGALALANAMLFFVGFESFEVRGREPYYVRVDALMLSVFFCNAAAIGVFLAMLIRRYGWTFSM